MTRRAFYYAAYLVTSFGLLMVASYAVNGGFA